MLIKFLSLMLFSFFAGEGTEITSEFIGESFQQFMFCCWVAREWEIGCKQKKGVYSKFETQFFNLKFCQLHMVLLSNSLRTSQKISLTFIS